jgi:hypothetical protein
MKFNSRRNRSPEALHEVSQAISTQLYLCMSRRNGTLSKPSYFESGLPTSVANLWRPRPEATCDTRPSSYPLAKRCFQTELDPLMDSRICERCNDAIAPL